MRCRHIRRSPQERGGLLIEYDVGVVGREVERHRAWQVVGLGEAGAEYVGEDLEHRVMIDCANPITGILGVLEQSRAEGYGHIDPHYIGRDLPTSRRRWRRCWASGMVRDSNPQNSGE